MGPRVSWLLVCAGLVLAALAWWRSPAVTTEPSVVVAAPSAPPYEAPRSAPRQAGACSHRYIPNAAGVELTYAVRTETGGRVTEGVAFLEATAVSALGIETTWSLDVSLEGIAPLHTTARRRCVAGRGAEEPWTHPSMGILEERGARWLWPLSLEPGQEFGGNLELAAPGSEDDAPPSMTISRVHRVVGEEDVTVLAGSFRAWRIDFEEHNIAGTVGFDSTGTTWVGEHVGMVRTETRTAAGATTSWELRSYLLP